MELDIVRGKLRSEVEAEIGEICTWLQISPCCVCGKTGENGADRQILVRKAGFDNWTVPSELDDVLIKRFDGDTELVLSGKCRNCRS